MGLIRGVIFDLGRTLMYLSVPGDEVTRRGAADLAAFLVNRGFALDASSFSEAFLEQRRLLKERARAERVEYTAELALRTTLTDFGYPEVEAELVRRAIESFFSYEEAHWKAYPDAVETLRRLSEAGYRLGLVSNATDDAIVQRLVERAGFRPWLDPVISSAGVGIRKPDPAIFRIVLERWGIAAHEAVMVGNDLEADILGAKLTGMWSILIRRGPTNVQSTRIAPDAEVDELSELPEAIASLGNL